MRKIKEENVIEITEEVKVGNGIILEKGDKIKVLTMSEAGQRTGEIQSKDWDRMLDLVLAGKDGSGAARSIKDKNKAIARYVAGIKLSSSYWGEFDSFYDKAIELGATKTEIDLVIANTVIPDNVAEKYKSLKNKKLNNRFVGVISKEVLKMGFDIDFLPYGGNAFTNEGRDAMRRNGRKWTIGYKTEISINDKKIDFVFDAITDEGSGPTSYVVYMFDRRRHDSRPKGQREFLTWLKSKLNEYKEA